MKDRLLFIDTETGGLDPNKHSLLSVALVVWENKQIIDSCEIFINDGILSVTKEALAVNNIDIETHKQTAISPSLAIEKILEYTSKHFPSQNKVTIAGHNVHFDVAFLKRMFEQNGHDIEKYYSHRIIDTSSVLHYLYIKGTLKEKVISSDAAFTHFYIKVDGRHTALGDAIATAELFSKLLELR